MKMKAVIIEKKNQTEDYNLILNYDKTKKSEYLKLPSVSTDIEDDNYAINVYYATHPTMRFNDYDNFYIDNKPVTISEYLQIVFRHLPNNMLLQMIPPLKKLNKTDIEFLLGSRTYAEPVKKQDIPKHFYVVNQNYYENEYTRHYNRLVIISDKNYLEKDLFDLVCKFYDQEWAEFDKDGYVVNSPWYQPPRKEKITMHTQSFDYVTYLINDRHNKNFNHYNDLVFLQLKDDNLYPVTIETVEQYGKVSETQLQTYMNFLLFKELKARYVYDECIKQLLLSGIEKSK